MRTHLKNIRKSLRRYVELKKDFSCQHPLPEHGTENSHSFLKNIFVGNKALTVPLASAPETRVAISNQKRERASAADADAGVWRLRRPSGHLAPTLIGAGWRPCPWRCEAGHFPLSRFTFTSLTCRSAPPGSAL